MTGQPAQAYYSLFSPFYWGSSISPVRTAFNPLRYGNYGYASGGAYLIGSLLWNAAYYPAYRYRWMRTENYQDAEPLSDPRSRVRPYRPHLAATDVVSHAQWKQPVPTYRNPVPYAGQETVLPQASSGGTLNTPFADGFVQMVNQRFDGDISQALFDPDSRAWARALGLIQTDDIFDLNLSDKRIDLIRNVLQDESLNSVGKVKAVAILLNHRS